MEYNTQEQLERGRQLYDIVEEAKSAYIRSTRGKIPTLLRMNPEDYEALAMYCVPTIRSFKKMTAEDTILGMRIETDPKILHGLVQATIPEPKITPSEHLENLQEEYLDGERRVSFMLGLLAGFLGGGVLVFIINYLINY